MESGAVGATVVIAPICLETQGVRQASRVGEISGVNATGGGAVVVNLNGQLRVMSLSRRYKEDIQ